MSKNDKTKYTKQIYCRMEFRGSGPKPCVPFQRDKKILYVPVNEWVPVPDWAYETWLHSEYAPDYDPLRGVDTAHLVEE